MAVVLDRRGAGATGREGGQKRASEGGRKERSQGRPVRMIGKRSARRGEESVW